MTQYFKRESFRSLSMIKHFCHGELAEPSTKPTLVTSIGNDQQKTISTLNHTQS
jgi:hypothetical protein